MGRVRDQERIASREQGHGRAGSSTITATMPATASKRINKATATAGIKPECQSTRKIFHFARDIKPPVLGSQEEYCHQVLAQGLVRPNCELGKAAAFIYPKSLFFGREEGEKPESSTELKNWKKWCRAWKQVESRVKKDVLPPSIMTSGEGHRRKKEDIELIDRTIHEQHLTGFNIYPQPPRGELLSIEERQPRRIYRDYPPMEKIRISKEIRKEMGLPLRAAPSEPADLRLSSVWKWERRWDETCSLQETKDQLKPSMEPYEPLHPCPDQLTLIGNLVSLDNRIGLGESKATKYYPYPPDIIFTKDSEDVMKFPQTDHNVERGELGEVYREHRGPVLYVQGEKVGHHFFLHHHQKAAALKRENERLNRQLVKDDDEQIYLTDSMDGFSATTKCKEVRYVVLRNDGTTSIRYQWLRAPPNTAMRRLIANPGRVLAPQPTPVDNYCDCIPADSSEHKNVHQNPNQNTAVHLTSSRTIDPGLTRTIKLMRNCVTADRAYENLLLLLSLRVPRLRRLLVKRTGRQFKAKKLPLYIQQLYWRNLEKKKIKREPEPIPKEVVIIPDEDLTHPIMIHVTSPSPPQVETEGEDEEIPDVCYCPCCEATQNEWLAEHDGEDQTDHICRCILPCSHRAAMERAGETDFRGRAPCEPDEMHGEFGGEGGNQAMRKFSEEVLQCFAGWGEDGEGTVIDYPTGATPDFFPLYKGHRQTTTTTITSFSPLKGLPKCRDLIPKLSEVQTLAKPKTSLQAWMTTQMRDSLQEPPPEDLLLHVTDSDPWEPKDPARPIFREMRGYQVTQDYHSKEHDADIIIGQQLSCPILDQEGDENFLFGGEADGTRPVRAIWEKYHLDTESISNLRGESTTSFASPTSKEGYFNSLSPVGSEINIHDVLSEEGEGTGYEGDEGEIMEEQAIGDTNEQEPKRPKKHEHILEILKEPSFEFHFRELPGVLLPGQVLEFPIIFRPRKTGVFHETIYLLMHPRISPKTFCIRLNGICVDPDTTQLEGSSAKKSSEIQKSIDEVVAEKSSLPVKTTDSGVGIGGGGGGKEKTQVVERHLYETMLRQQGIDLLDSVMDHVLFTHQTRASTLPYGKVTKEALFLAHNPDLNYHFGTCEKALETIRVLCSLLVPKKRISEDSNLCQLNLLDMYSTFWDKAEPEPEEDKVVDQNNNEQDTEQTVHRVENMFERNLNSDFVEHLLTEFADCTKIMIQPRVFALLPMRDYAFHATYSTMVALLDQIITGFEDVRMSYDDTEFDEYLLKSLKEKQAAEAAAAAEAQKKQVEEQEASQVEAGKKSSKKKKIDVATQKSVVIENDEEEDDDDGQIDQDKIKVVVVDEPEPDQTNLPDVTKSEDASHAIASLEDNIEPSGKKGKSSKKKQKKNRLEHGKKHPKKDSFLEHASAEEISLRQAQNRKCGQLKQLMVEKYLGDGIAKMVSVLDTYNSSSSYNPTSIIRNTDPTHYCC